MAATGDAPARARARFYLRKEVARCYGEYGLAHLARLEAAGALPDDAASDWFERAEAAVFRDLPTT